MFSVLQRRKHWYKIKFPKKKSHHSPFWWILQSQISLHSKVVMKHMIHREGSFALFGQGWWAGMTGVCVCVVFPAIWNAIGSIFFCSILYPNSFFLCSTCENIHCLEYHWYFLSLLFLPCPDFTSFLNIPQPTVCNRSSLCSLHFMPDFSPAAFCCSSYLLQDLLLTTARAFCCCVTGFPPSS